MKIIATGDHHFNIDSRWSECVKAHQWLSREVRDHKPDLFLSGGDLYHSESTPLERRCVANWLISIADICPVILTKGNHDSPLDCHILGRLRAAHPIYIEEKAEAHIIAGAMVGAVAWPDKASLSSITDRPLSIEELDDLGADALRNVFRSFGAQEFNGPRILLGHFMIDGSTTGAGQPLIGKELHIGLTDLALSGAHMVIASHIHKAQEFEFDGMPVVLPGSIYRRDFGEMETKSYVIAEFDGSRLVDWSRVESPAAPMIHCSGDWGPDGDGKTGWISYRGAGADIQGADIRFRYTVEPDRRDEARLAAARLQQELLSRGAGSVKLEAKTKTSIHARAPEIAAAKTLEDKLSAYWTAAGADLSEERRSRLLNLLPQLRGNNEMEKNSD